MQRPVMCHAGKCSIAKCCGVSSVFPLTDRTGAAVVCRRRLRSSSVVDATPGVCGAHSLARPKGAAEVLLSLLLVLKVLGH